MDKTPLHSCQVDALAVLANGIIPTDQRDAGAAAVNAGPRLAEKMSARSNAELYVRGLELADRVARESYGVPVAELTPPQVHNLIARVRDELPAFFKQLRMDVSALYLSDPAVWKRIGFPGPSSQSGGYPDFDRRQLPVITSPPNPGAGAGPER